MNKLKLAARKINLQTRQVLDLRPYKKSNPTRYKDQINVLAKLVNPFILFNSKPIPKDLNKPYVKYLNGLTNLAKNEIIYKMHIKSFKQN